MNCQAQVDDVDNATRFNLIRVIVSYTKKPCSRKAVGRLGHLCFCTQHLKLAKEGLIADNGNVESRGVIRDVRRYPKKFTGGIHSWARGLEVTPL